MIVSFRHKGLETFFRKSSKKGIQPAHAKKLSFILSLLDVAQGPEDMNLSSFKMHSLSGGMKGYWSVWVNGNWRVTYRFIGHDVELVDYQDYH